MTLERYILRRLLSRSLLLGFLIAVAALSVDLGTTGPFWAARSGWAVVVEGTLLHLPLHVVLMLPVASLLSGAIVTANLASNGELEALSACGAHPLRLGGALIAAGAALLVFALVCSELVVPRCEAAAARLYHYQRASSVSGAGERGSWVKGPNGWLVRLVRSEHASRDPWPWHAFRLDIQHRVVAYLSGTLEPSSLKARAVQTRQRGPTLPPTERAALVTFVRGLGDAREVLPPEALPIGALLKRTRRARQRGQTTQLDELMLQTRLAFPLLNPLVGLLLWGMAIARGRRGTAALLRSSVGWACCLWLIVAVGWQLGQAHALTPTAGAWLPIAGAALLAAGSLARARARHGSLAA